MKIREMKNTQRYISKEHKNNARVLGEGSEIVHKSKLMKKKNCIPLNINQRNSFRLQHDLMSFYTQTSCISSGRRRGGMAWADLGLVFGQFTGKPI